MDTFEIPDGQVAEITTGEYICGICGTEAENVTYYARATGEYATDDTGRMRRKFRFVGRKPVCNCSNYIWLSSEENDCYLAPVGLFARLFAPK